MLQYQQTRLVILIKKRRSLFLGEGLLVLLDWFILYGLEKGACPIEDW